MQQQFTPTNGKARKSEAQHVTQQLGKVLALAAEL
jgi:hypothetical protein